MAGVCRHATLHTVSTHIHGSPFLPYRAHTNLPNTLSHTLAPAQKVARVQRHWGWTSFSNALKTHRKEACEGGIEGKESEQEAEKAGSERPLP